MALSPGSHLGSYEVTALISQGAMGEVYGARDAKLGRDVASKVLPELFADDPERLARFQREARALAPLNHPTSPAPTASKRASAGHLGHEPLNRDREPMLEIAAAGRPWSFDGAIDA